MHVRWNERPQVQAPIVVAAWEGWNDAGDAATTAVSYLASQWDAEPFAEIDPEEFYDFTETRPRIEFDDDGERLIAWPSNVFSAATTPSGLSLVFFEGIEPQLRWRTYCEQILDVARTLDARLVLTLGALLAEVPHTRPVAIYGTAYDPAVIAALALEPSTYEGPTGIVGALHSLTRSADVNSASLWAAVPTYVSGAPAPKAALALVVKACELLGTDVATTGLEIAAAEYERQVSELVEDDEHTSAYVQSLEDEYDHEQATIGTADNLVDELERFLRDQ